MDRFLIVLGGIGGSFRGLGGSWAALGRLLEGLGRLLGRLETVLGRHGLLGSFSAQQAPLSGGTWRDFGSQKGAKMEAKSDPRGKKNDVKNEDEKRRS